MKPRSASLVQKLPRFALIHLLGVLGSTQQTWVVAGHFGWVLFVLIALHQTLPAQGLPTRELGQVLLDSFVALGGVDEQGHGGIPEMTKVYGKLLLVVYAAGRLFDWVRGPRRTRWSAWRKITVSTLVACAGFSLAAYLHRSTMRGSMGDAVFISVFLGLFIGGATAWAVLVTRLIRHLQRQLHESLEDEEEEEEDPRRRRMMALVVGGVGLLFAYDTLWPAVEEVLVRRELRHFRRQASEASAGLAPREETASGRASPEDGTLRCERGEARACTMLGSMYEHGGLGVEKNEVLALALHARACGLGNMQGCVSQGWMLEQGRGAAADPSRAAVFFLLGCEAGVADGCEGVAYLHESGRGVEKSPERYVAYLEKACELGDLHACANAAGPHASGEGIPRNASRAEQLLKRSCQDGLEYGCQKLRDFQASK